MIENGYKSEQNKKKNNFQTCAAKQQSNNVNSINIWRPVLTYKDYFANIFHNQRVNALFLLIVQYTLFITRFSCLIF